MLKRAFDVVVSGVALLFLAPVLAVVAVLVVLDSGFPILFKQQRVGMGFKPFHIFKFRSMRTNTNGAEVTVKGDRRVTRIGRILRATKADELPQLWNVLHGSMSIVGPRPEVLKYVSLYKERYGEILKVRPGITDLASIRFRNEEAILAGSANPEAFYADVVLPEKLDLAEEYVRTRTFQLDLKIIFHTAAILPFALPVISNSRAQ